MCVGESGDFLWPHMKDIAKMNGVFSSVGTRLDIYKAVMYIFVCILFTTAPSVGRVQLLQWQIVNNVNDVNKSRPIVNDKF